MWLRHILLILLATVLTAGTRSSVSSDHGHAKKNTQNLGQCPPADAADAAEAALLLPEAEEAAADEAAAWLRRRPAQTGNIDRSIDRSNGHSGCCPQRQHIRDSAQSRLQFHASL